MKNKPLLFAIIYSALFIAAACITFYGHYDRAFNTVFVMGLAALLPFVVLTIKVQRDTVYKGVISGREAAKEGMRFVFFSFIFLVIFQVAFFYGGLREYRLDYLMKGELEFIQKSIENKKMAATPAEMAKQAKAIAGKVAMINVSTEIFGVFLRVVLFGLFSSFVAALFLKRGNS